MDQTGLYGKWHLKTPQPNWKQQQEIEPVVAVKKKKSVKEPKLNQSNG